MSTMWHTSTLQQERINRFTYDKSWHLAASSKKRDTRAPEAAIKLGQPNVFDVPFSASTEPRVYKNLHFNVTEEAKAVNRQAKWAKLWKYMMK